MAKSTKAENRYAVCIGINEYHTSTGLSALRFAESDAQAMDTLLGRLGFAAECRCLLVGGEATLEAVNEALSLFILDKPRENDFVVFYFAGHSLPLTINEPEMQEGVEPRSEVFLTTYDFNREQIKRSLSYRKLHALGMERLRKDFFEGEGSRKRLFLFDSCYSGDFYGPRYRDETDPVQGYIKHMLDSNTVGRIALSSCLPFQKATEETVLGHGRFTYYVLQALSGRAVEALRRDGCLTVNGLFEYLATQLPSDQRPVLSGVQQDTFELICYPENMDGQIPVKTTTVDTMGIEKITRLRSMVADHNAFMRDRLGSFVGRAYELTEVHRYIASLSALGGYITIMGQPGQGKSSLIAKLVQVSDQEKTLHHFIPINPGPDYQVSLLRDLMARLILKYDLSDFYVFSENRTTLRGYFHKMLTEIAAKGQQEVIFIDGLDQLKEDIDGERDLSFLPNNPPEGIVFVLGTRPNDTLYPLELRKPQIKYDLPDLGRQDFDLILKHRGVILDKVLADQFYEVMQKNALYLDLISKEMASEGIIRPEDIIERVTDNPDNTFSLSIAPLKKHILEWRQVLKLILGILLAAREPLAGQHIRQILEIEDDQLREGLTRLGGLIIDDGKRRYSLFHLKLQDYLRQDEHRPRKEYIFAVDEEAYWHQVLATWCEKNNLSLIWEDIQGNPLEQMRREYARQHYITHLYYARQWQKLFNVLDRGDYGRAKVLYDLGMRSYAQDLDLGRRAAAWDGWTIEEGLSLLPCLWRYTLLRCSLTSRADHYNLAMFEVLIAQKRVQEALGLAELLTNPIYKVRVLIYIAQQVKEQLGEKLKHEQLLMRAYEGTRSIKGRRESVSVLAELSDAFAQAQIWEYAEDVAYFIEDSSWKVKVLGRLGAALLKAQQWKHAEEIFYAAKANAASIKDVSIRTEVLGELGKSFFNAQQLEWAAAIWKEAEKSAHIITERGQRSETLKGLGRILAQAQQWDLAEAIVRSISDRTRRAEALKELGRTLVQAQQWDLAERLIYSVEYINWKTEMLEELAKSLSEAQQWTRAALLWGKINASIVVTDLRRVELLSERAKALTFSRQKELATIAWNEIKQLLSSIESVEQHAKALSELGKALAQVQEWDQAEEIINSIGIFDRKNEALGELGSVLIQAQEWERAEKVIKSINMDIWKVKRLKALGKALSEAKQWKQADKIWTNAIEIARSVISDGRKTELLRELGQTLSEAQQWGKAIKLWKEAEDTACSLEGDERTRALYELGKVLIRVQYWEQATRIISSVDSAWMRADLLGEQGRGLIQAKEWKKATSVWTQLEAVVRSIEEGEQRTRALCALGDSLFQARHEQQALAMWTEAEKIARSIEKDEQRVKTLCALGRTLTKFQQGKQAVGVWKEAIVAACLLQEAMSFALSDRERQVKVLQELGEALIESQQWERAEVVIYSIKDWQLRSGALRELVEYFVKAQQWERAEKVAYSIEDGLEHAQALKGLVKALAEAQHWKIAENVAHSIKDWQLRSEALRELVKALAQARQWDQAEKVACFIQEWGQSVEALRELGEISARAQQWDQAGKIIRAINVKEQRAKALAELGKALAEAHQWQFANVVWSETEQVANSIEEEWERAEVLRMLSTILAQAQQWEQAERVARAINVKEQRAKALAELGKALAEAHQWQFANVVWSETEQVANSIEEEWERAEVLRMLSTILAQAQQWEQAERVANAIKINKLKAEMLKELGEILTKSQRWKQAAGVWAEVETMMTTTSLVLVRPEVAKGNRFNTQFEEKRWREESLLKLARALEAANEYKQLLHLLQESWLHAETRKYAINVLPLASRLIPLKPEIYMALYEAFGWVDTFLSD